ncbi:Monopolin complex subunit pcs1 [Pseudocercospora fuligena]|uniref:Monopolin complex subunit pcs1 n=1 Tax=Pseudocercospora fuligena TaxID=685502 RepID=A0A8H6VF31_9PEZI|nr:Monopolin complex subunit pcs1 [Pseudocercospora fuligena]
MPPRAKAQAPAAEDSEDDLATTTTTTRGAAQNKRGPPKMPKAKTAARRLSATKPATKRKAATKQPRQALKDRTNIQDGNETEEVDAFDDEDMAAKPKAKKAKTATTRKTAAAKAQATEDEPEKAPAKRGRKPKRAPSPEPLLTIPETQPDPPQQEEDVEQSIEVDPDNMDIEKEPTPKRVPIYVQRAPSVPIQPLQPRPSARGAVRAASVQPAFPPIRERSNSASGTERRGGDPELRRQLNDLTSKYENLNLKYQGLQDIQQGGETNFEKLKRASDQKAKDANDLIASLRKEITELRKTSNLNSSETNNMQKQVTSLTTSNEKLTAERNDLKEKLQLSQNEVKSLEAKLMAARQQVANAAQESKAQEVAKKQNSSVSVNVAEAQKEAKMKENLYADLTGLIIANVKRNEGEDIYDCIQTGRNGTLHFHLNVGNDATTPHPKTPSGLNYEDAEFAYEPLLDESRDRELLELLPDYLTEEICFPRNHAQRFYSKVVESMTKKFVVEED